MNSHRLMGFPTPRIMRRSKRMHRSKNGPFMSASGQSRPRRLKPHDGACPLCPESGQLADHLGMSALCRYCSLIPGFGVKLSMISFAGPTVLSAVGACPPHDVVRRRWWINVASAVSPVESSQKIWRSHHCHRPVRDVFSRRAAGTL